MIRLFLALPLSEGEAQVLWNKWEPSRFSSPRIRWTPADQYHITVLFFGDLEKSEIPVICAQMDEAARLYSSLKVKTDGPGQFPFKGHPRVFIEHLIEQGATAQGQLSSLQHYLYLNLKDRYKLGNRRFRPHITTARIGGNPKNTVIDLFNGESGFYVSDEISFTLENLVLFESVLRPDGAVYSPLYSVKL
ncbi:MULTISPECIES: RNA 2',3'-cyclic phosphodiesterase [unclassified Oceanispirochaeta]|uniref:RNA 2',3'-cyclic phosphodiesterase n=1 Tax=unclassified Oceanispirochaeta TaxID=2635722 RepID=UPI000E08E9CA|nr:MULTISPECIES: RNA 2',3'-cyclic phosphodiesterase [unclassified Oceanispirochaeta]MBF9014900.1 RNA 2',3'-cyclic phosphodiesterase [Oceanispirochaeta sp. M2]NPD71419.1 RNA 2',3'-cyclic phosphodiesterase [Oceanispirochaeta sp. M1]RDG33380.1 RNA 2',3'-cyclic phosphodiesterase [Oceanispirochaeta sp. M1]